MILGIASNGSIVNKVYYYSMIAHTFLIVDLKIRIKRYTVYQIIKLFINLKSSKKLMMRNLVSFLNKREQYITESRIIHNWDNFVSNLS